MKPEEQTPQDDNLEWIDKYLSNPNIRRDNYDDSFSYKEFNEMPTCCCSLFAGAILFLYDKITGNNIEESDYSD